MKTILHISKYYYPYNGGIESVARQLAEGLTGYKHVVICFSSNHDTVEDLVNGVQVYRVGVQTTFMSQAIALSYKQILKDVIARHQPDVVHLHAPNPFVYPIVLHAVPRHIPLVLHWHSDILAKGIFYDIVRPLENRVLNRAEIVLATSPIYVEKSSQLQKVTSKLQVLPNGVITEDLQLRRGDEKRIAKIRSEYEGRPIVLFVGRHIPYKGVDKLIAAAHLIKQDSQILIAGTGPETSLYKRLAANLPNVRFVGRLSANDIRCYYHAADIFAFPSVNKAEAFGVALAEAMYCGAVPVTFTLPGSGVNWVSPAGVTGLEVPLNDVQALAHAIDTLATDSALREQYSSAARKRVEECFTDEVVLDAARRIYEQLFD